MRGIDIHHPPLFWWPAWDLLTAYWPPTVTSTGLWTICHPGWSLFFVGWVEGFPHSTDPQETCGVRTSRNDACDCPKNRLSPFHLLLKKIMFTIELPHFGVPVYQNFQTYPISIKWIQCSNPSSWWQNLHFWWFDDHLSRVWWLNRPIITIESAFVTKIDGGCSICSMAESRFHHHFSC